MPWYPLPGGGSCKRRTRCGKVRNARVVGEGSNYDAGIPLGVLRVGQAEKRLAGVWCDMVMEALAACAACDSSTHTRVRAPTPQEFPTSPAKCLSLASCRPPRSQALHPAFPGGSTIKPMRPVPLSPASRSHPPPVPGPYAAVERPLALRPCPTYRNHACYHMTAEGLCGSPSAVTTPRTAACVQHGAPRPRRPPAPSPLPSALRPCPPPPGLLSTHRSTRPARFSPSPPPSTPMPHHATHRSTRPARCSPAAPWPAAPCPQRPGRAACSC